MNENKIKPKDEKHFTEKFHSNNKDNSSQVSKKANQKNTLIINKILPQTHKKHNLLSDEHNQSKIKKNGFISLTQKSTSNNIKTSKTFNKNNSNNSSKIIFPKQTNLKISLTYNGASSTQNMIENNKITEINSNNKNKDSEHSKNFSGLKNIKKVNTLVKSNKNKRKENKGNNKWKKIDNEENDIFNFTTEEYDENINENDLNKNSRKHYSLTNPSVLPCISFSNPFTNKNNNINITENSEKNIKHVRSLNIDNNYDLKKRQLLMEKNYLENLDIINVFKDNNDNNTNEEPEKEEEDVKLNISNLDIDINQIDEELEERNIQKNNKNSFIQFNNNLSLKLAAEKSNNTPSYMLALCPKLFLTKNKKDLIKENYAVNEPISEEVDSDSKTPRQSKIKYSLEENNTKYTTKEKYSDRNNKKFQEYDSENISFDVEDKKNTIHKISEKKNNMVINLKKNKKIIKEINSKEIIDENKNLFVDRKREGIRKKINLNEIQIDIQNIDNTNIYKDFKQFKIMKDNNISPKDIASHFSNNTINNIIFYETEKNLIKYMNKKIKKQKNIDSSEKHQKAKSLLTDINLSTLYLYETIQNNSSSKNNSHNKSKKILKINNKQKDFRNKILNKEKKIIDNLNTEEVKTPKKTKSKINNKININRNSHYKDNENKNIYRTSYSNTNINHNQNHLKKKPLAQFVKSPKNKVNPFLSNFQEVNDKFSYNNDLNYTLNNSEFKYKNYYDFSKKRNNISKLSNINNNTICVNNTNNKSSKNIIKDTNNMTHQKKISQQFIDEFNFMLELKSDNNISKNNNKIKIFNQKNKKYINKDNSKKINNSFKTVNKLKEEMNGKKLKKSQFIVPCHKKSKTFFISPSYVLKKNNINSEQNKHFYKRISNNNKENKKSIYLNDFNTTVQNDKKNAKINKNKKIYNTAQKSTNNRKIFDIKMIKNSTIKGKNKFKEIKKVIGENTCAKILHKKTNTIGNTNALSFLCQNLFNYNNLIQSSNQNIFNNNNPTKNNNCINLNNQHKKSASINSLINNLDNKKKIICAMQRIKFIPVSYYSKAIKEMTQINNNLLVILVYKDENQRFVFRALYEVNVNDPQYAKKIFGPNCELNVLNINNVNNFYNYSLSSGELFRYKIIDEKNKKFNDDIVIIF